MALGIAFGITKMFPKTITSHGTGSMHLTSSVGEPTRPQAEEDITATGYLSLSFRNINCSKSLGLSLFLRADWMREPKENNLSTSALDGLMVLYLRNICFGPTYLYSISEVRAQEKKRETSQQGLTRAQRTIIFLDHLFFGFTQDEDKMKMKVSGRSSKIR